MKTLTLCSLLTFALFASGRPAPTSSLAECHARALAPIVRDDPPPPPVDCPMCGGDAEAHKRTTKFFVRLHAQVLLWSSCHSLFLF